MSEGEVTLRALERLIRNNPDLEGLETTAGQFNPFVAMGWTRQEVRHSAFLRWVLDPEWRIAERLQDADLSYASEPTVGGLGAPHGAPAPGHQQPEIVGVKSKLSQP